MPTLDATQLPPPTNWQDFETLCHVLWRDLWQDPNAHKNGRSGQSQQGVDVYGRPGGTGEYEGVQCKCKEQCRGAYLSLSEVAHEVEEAEAFTPSLSRLIVATTCPRDARLQEEVRKLADERAKQGDFSVDVWFWEDIREEVGRRQGVAKTVYPDLFPSEESKAEERPSGLSALVVRYPLPTPLDANPFIDLGIRGGEEALSDQAELPEYIGRDIDEELDKRLSSRFVLIVGPAAWGKTRTAYEAVKRNCPNHRLLIPEKSLPDELKAAINLYASNASELGPAILWLDDIERYVGTANLRLIGTFLAAGESERVVATVRSDEYDRIMRSGEMSKDFQDLISLAGRPIRVREISSDEKRRAQAAYPDRSFTSGIGESFVGTPILRDAFENARDSRQHLFALVMTVIDWQRTRVRTPITDEWLRELYPRACRSLLPGTPASAAIEDVVRDATERIQGFRLVAETANGYAVDDSLVQHASNEFPKVSDVVWSFAVEKCEGVDLLLTGYSAYLSENMTVAESAFRKGMSLDDMFSAHNLGVVLKERRDIDSAKNALTKAVELGSGLSAALLGELAEEAGDLEEAKRQYEKGIELDASEGAVSLGDLLRQAGDFDGARRALQKGVEMGDGIAANNLGTLLKENRDLDGAIRAFEKAIELGREDSLPSLGVALMERGHLDEATTTFERGVVLGDGRCANNLGILYERLDDRDRAKEAYLKGIELGTGMSAAALGILLEDDGDYDGAKQAYKTGIDLKEGQAAVNLGLLLDAEGDIEAAKEVYEAGIALGNGQAANCLGTLLLESDDLTRGKNLTRAKEAFRIGVELGDARSATNLGQILHNEGNTHEAKALFELVMELGYVEAAWMLGMLLIEQGKTEEAKKACQQAVELGSGIAANNLGVLFAKEDNLDEARKAWEKGSEFGDANAAHNLGKLLLRQGETDAANQAFRRAEELGFGKDAEDSRDEDDT